MLEPLEGVYSVGLSGAKTEIPVKDITNFPFDANRAGDSSLMSDDPKRPILMLLTSNWVSLLGVALVTTAGFSWLFTLPTQLRGHANNPTLASLFSS